jgi:hypothetical protein
MEACDDYVRMQCKFETWFSDPLDKKTTWSFFCQLQENQEGMAFIRKKHCGLELLIFALENGKIHTMKPWLVNKFFEALFKA